MKNKQHSILLKDKAGIKPWLYFLSATFVILILSPLFQKGCFMDGLLYQTVAYNYGKELSSFWQMKFTNTSMDVFCEQPPLYFYLLGNFYKCFGNHYLVDRFYTLLLFIFLVLILNIITKQLFTKKNPYLLLVVFFLLAVPVFCWSYVNQAIEPLLCVLTALCILFFLKFINSNKNVFLLLFTIGLCLLFLAKGFQSCFIIGLPLSYTFLSKFKKSNYYFSGLSSGIFLVLLFSCLKFYTPAKAWFDCYYNARLVLTMQNVGNTTDNHFEIIGRFFSELIVCIGFMGVLFSYLKINRKYPLMFALKNFTSNKIAVSLLLTSFLGSFPYAISLVQRGFYLIPSFICFVLAIVYGFKRYWLFLFLLLVNIGKFKFTRVLFIVIIIGSGFYFCLMAPTYKRNKDLLTDIHLILPYLEKDEIVGIDTEMWNHFSLHSYLYSAKQVSLSLDKKNRHFLIRYKSSMPGDTSLQKIDLNTSEIDLYRMLK